MNKISKEYILSLTKIITPEGCWIHEEANVTWIGKKKYFLHRLSAYLWHGGFDIDIDYKVLICHNCKNDTNNYRVCFNPEHIYVGSNTSNMLDAVRDKTHVQSRKTLCPYGHEYSGYDKTNGKVRGRHCSICRREALRRWRDKKKRLRNNGKIK